MWASLAKEYASRRDVFVKQTRLTKRCAALVARFRANHNVRILVMDAAAAIVLAF